VCDFPQDGKIDQMMKLFAQPWVFGCAVSQVTRLPPPSLKEIAFIGRSNVGKSSFLNSLLNRKRLARTSNTPGCTRSLNFYFPAISLKGDEAPSVSRARKPRQYPVAMVDMPGYGFARAPRIELDTWISLVFEYLRNRKILLEVCLLVDSRFGFTSRDLRTIDLLEQSEIEYLIVLTKLDKIVRSPEDPRVHNLVTDLETQMQSMKWHRGIWATSVSKRWGLDAVRREICTRVVSAFETCDQLSSFRRDM